MRIDVITMFPEIFSGYLNQSLLAKAIDRGLIQLQIHNLRLWSTDPKHHKLDDRPYGGGPGMLIQVPPVVECVEAVQAMGDVPGQVVLLTPQGRRLSQPWIEEAALLPRLILLCGRYEGFDQRVIDILHPWEVSIGDYVLMDSTIRMIPGVLGDEQSHWDDSFSRGNRILEFPQYTRPREYRGHAVPDVLLSGDHARIAAWRAEQSRQKTKQQRNDLLP
jgi:tRNA (guanine37-N1)-methyltransferase